MVEQMLGAGIKVDLNVASHLVKLPEQVLMQFE